MSEHDEQHESVILRGRVKWFDPGRGYGFVVADEGGDILLHANVLRNFGQNSVADEAEIEIEVGQSPRGRQAVRVLSISAPEAPERPRIDLLEGVDLEAIGPEELVPARVKWFDKAKGFGFANAFGREGDIFIHTEVLRVSGFADLQPGEAICLATREGPRGLMAVLVRAWDAVLTAPEG